MLCAVCGDGTTEGSELCAACQQEQLPELVPVSAGNAATSTSTAQPGWYVDPSSADRQRYWNGSAWASTSHPANSFAYSTAAPLAPVAVKGMMSFPEAVKSVLSKYVGFSGRARRSEYWWFSLLLNGVSMVVYFCVFVVALITAGQAGATSEEIAIAMEGVENLALIILLPLILAIWLPSLAVTIRRLHDTNRSGWFSLISAIPIAGLVVLVVLCEDSTRGPNRYGPSPKYV